VSNIKPLGREAFTNFRKRGVRSFSLRAIPPGFSLFRLLVFVAAACAAACGARPQSPGASERSGEEARTGDDERAAEKIPLVELTPEILELGRPEQYSGSSDDQRLKLLAEYAARTDDRKVASSALRMRLQRARLRHALYRLESGREKRARTGAEPQMQDAQLEVVRREVVRAADALEDGWLVMDALKTVSAAELDSRQRAVLLRAIERVQYLQDEEVYRTALNLRRSQSAQVRLYRKKPYRAKEFEPSDEQLAALGPEAIDLLDRRFNDAVRSGDAKKAWRLAELLVREDPLHLGARIALILRRDVAGSLRRLKDTTLKDVLGASQKYGWNGSALARLDHLLGGAREKGGKGGRAGRKRNAGPAYRLGFAMQAWRVGMEGDCRVALRLVDRRSRARRHVSIAADTLEALCAFASGDLRAYGAWADRAAVERSFFVTRYLADFAQHGKKDGEKDKGKDKNTGKGKAPELQVETAKRALRTAVERGYPIPNGHAFLLLLTDPKQDERLRRLVRERLLTAGYELPVLDTCIKKNLDYEKCDHLFGAVWTLDDPDEGSQSVSEALEAIEQIPDYRIDWSELAHYVDEESLQAVVRRLRGLKGRASSSGQLFVSLVALLHGGEVEPCARQLERYGRLLSVSERLALRLAMAAIGKGAKPAAVLDELWVGEFPGIEGVKNVPLDRDKVARIDEKWYPEKHHLEVCQRGYAYYHEGFLARALKVWEPLLSLLPPSDRTELEASMVMARYHSGDRRRAREAARVITERARDTSQAQLIKAFLHEEAGQFEEARAAYRQALLIEPTSEEAFRGFMRILARQEKAGAEPMAAFMAALAPFNSAAEASRDIVVSVETDSPEHIATLCQRYDEAAFELSERGLRSPALDRRALGWLLDKVNSEEQPDDVIEWARRAVAYRARVDEDPGRAGQWAWIYFITGDAKRAKELISAEDEAAKSYSHPVWLLADLRASAVVDDALAVTIWRNQVRWNAEPLMAVQALQQKGLEQTSVKQYLCRLLVDANLVSAALDPCAEAWKRGRRNQDLAAAVSWLMVSAPDDAAAAGLTMRSVFDAPRASEATLGPAWLFNKGLIRVDQDRVQEASELIAKAWRADFDIVSYGFPEETTEKFARRPSLFVRFVTARNLEEDRAERHGALAFLSFMSADTKVARYYGEAARALGLDATTDFGRLLPSVADLSKLLNRDLEEGALSPRAAREAVAEMGGRNPEAVSELAGRHPESRFIDLLELEYYMVQGRFDKAAPIADALVEQFPSNLVVMGDAIGTYTLVGRRKEARKLLEHARRLYPQDLNLAQLATVLKDTGRGELPAWLKSPAGFDRKHGGLGLGLERYLALEPRREVSLEVEAEVFVPRHFVRDISEDLAFTSSDGSSVKITRFHRVSGCRAAECLEQMLPALAKRGLRPLWKRETELPIGEAIQVMFVSGSRATLMWLVPVGKHVYLIAAGVSADSLDDRLAAFHLIAESFRFLGAVLSSAPAESIRERLWRQAPDALRLRARLETARPGGGKRCSLRGTIAKAANPDELAAVLVDVFMSTAAVEQRRAIVACVKPDEERAKRLGVAALLDDDDALHRFGARVVERFPDAALESARALLDAGHQGHSTGGGTIGSELAPYGVLEVLLALPSNQRKSFCRDLLQSNEKEFHLLGLAAAVFDRDVVDEHIVQADIRTASPTVAILATLVVARSPSTAQLAAIRSRVDKLRRFDSIAGLMLSRVLARALASRVAAEDEARLSGLLERARAAKIPDSDDIVRDLGGVVATYHRALAVSRGESRRVSGADSRLADEMLARSWLQSREGRKQKRVEKVVSATDLYQRSLVELLPAGSWAYARLSQPGVFASVAQQLFERVDFGKGGTEFWMRYGLKRLADLNGLDLLSPDGGLDLRRPIECAQPTHGGFVCTAYVRDRSRVRDRLSRRPVGYDAGPAFTLGVMKKAMSLPLVVAMAPVVLHGILHEPESKEYHRRGGKLFAERIRTVDRIAGRTLDRYASVEVHENRGALVDHEHYLFIRDKLFIFGGTWLADMVLGHRPVKGGSLAEVLDFRKAIARWSDTAAMKGAAIWRDPEGRTRTAAAAFTLDPRGTSIEWVFERDRRDAKQVVRLLAGLPQGAASLAAIDMSIPFDINRDWLAGASTSNIRMSPPFGLLKEAGTIGFGWYPEAGDSLWKRWLAVMAWGPGLKKLLEKEGWPVPEDSAEAMSRGDILIKRVGGRLFLGSDADLLSSVSASPGRATTGAAAGALVAELKTNRMADVFDEIIASAKIKDRRRFVARLFSTTVRSCRDASLRGRWIDRATYLLNGRIDFKVRPEEPDRLDAGKQPLDVVKQLLAVNNTIPLPQSIRDQDRRGPLIYIFEVDDARRSAKYLFPRDSQRVEIDQRDARHLAVQVRPGPASHERSQPATLDAEKRRELLSSGRGIEVASPRVAAVAKRINENLDKKEPRQIAEHVVHWVRGYLRYEITPQNVGTVEILSRRRGDCKEYSILTVSLLRALGVPAKLENGLLASEDSMVAHTWVSYYDGTGWREIDPTNNLLEVGSGHIHASVPDVVGLLSMDRLRVIEVRSGSRGSARKH
jgi:transglutaminase-like putative cysteine protease/tetratricopeptide (TPR) repeat protein